MDTRKSKHTEKSSNTAADDMHEHCLTELLVEIWSSWHEISRRCRHTVSINPSKKLILQAHRVKGPHNLYILRGLELQLRVFFHGSHADADSAAQSDTRSEGRRVAENSYAYVSNSYLAVR
eukprot:6171847-Pleurochrysis_carterae.AAC.3